MAIHRSLNPKPLIWETIELGEELGPVEGVVSDFQVKSFAYAVDDYGAWYLDNSPFGYRIGHPTLLSVDVVRLYHLVYEVRPPMYQSGLHARNEIELLRPVPLGQKVILRGRYTEKYQKRGHDYVVLSGEVVDEAGQPFIRVRASETVGLGPNTPVGQLTGTPSRDAITGEVPSGAPIVEHASRQAPIGSVLPALVKRSTLEQSIAFSGFPYGWVEGGSKAMRICIHTDPEDARQHGLSEVILQALVSEAYMSEACTGFFGTSWLRTGRLSTIFIRPVIIGDTITTSGMVKRVEAEGERVRMHVDVWCRNQVGELTAVGRASAEVE